MPDIDAAVAELSAAIRELTAAGDKRRAAMASAQLFSLYAFGLGNLTAARGWLSRAERLVEDEEPCVEQGWVAIAPLGCLVDDPADLLARAELALDRARRFGDVDLETKALADAGLAHVQAGRIAEGMAMLDEAMALACGTDANPDSRGKSVCSFFTACYFSADFDRAASWASVFRQQGIIGPGPEGAFLSSHCDSVQATLLVELGQWSEAEALLVRTKEDFESASGLQSWHPTIALADLRIRQGRLAEAEHLLMGRDAAMEALLPAARLHLARGELELARAAAARGLRAMGGDRLRVGQLLAVLIDVDLARGDVDAAAAWAAELAGRTRGLDCPTVEARAAAAQAKVLAATGDPDGAVAAVERAVDGLTGTGAPWLRAALLLELARLHEQRNDRAAAMVEAKAAAAILADLDVALGADDVALLDRLTAGGRIATRATLTHDGKWWEARCADTCVRLPDTKGLQYLAELLATPGAERHALDLVDRVEGVGEVDRRTLGDAGDISDSAARTAYRRRIEGLRADIDDALAVGDADGAERLQAEVDELIGQLAHAFGLGGRSRKASSVAEKARLNVTRALRSATSRIVEALPDAGGALDRGIRTGFYCAYEPAEDDVRWIVQS